HDRQAWNPQFCISFASCNFVLPTFSATRGSGNVFGDLGRANADVEHFKARLAAKIIKALDRDQLSVRTAHDRTGIAAADFSRIRNADLGRSTVDRLM